MKIGNFIAISAQFLEIKEIALPLFQEISSKWGNKGSFILLLGGAATEEKKEEGPRGHLQFSLYIQSVGLPIVETCSGGVAQAKVRELFILHAFRDTDSPPPFAFPMPNPHKLPNLERVS